MLLPVTQYWNVPVSFSFVYLFREYWKTNIWCNYHYDDTEWHRYLSSVLFPCFLMDSNMSSIVFIVPSIFIFHVNRANWKVCVTSLCWMQLHPLQLHSIEFFQFRCLIHTELKFWWNRYFPFLQVSPSLSPWHVVIGTL